MDSGSGSTLADEALSNEGTLNTGSSGTTTASGMWSDNLQIGSNCLDFDGQDDVVRSFSTGISQKTKLTISLWVKIRSNSGDYRTLISATEDPYNDYEKGFTLDQGSDSTSKFNHLNLEFAGDQGVTADLKTSAHSFGKWVHITVRFSESEAVLFVNGNEEGSRSNNGTPLALNDIRIGARA